MSDCIELSLVECRIKNAPSRKNGKTYSIEVIGRMTSEIDVVVTGSLK